MKYTIIPDGARSKVDEADFPGLAEAKAAVEKRIELKRGWTTEWKSVQRNKMWTYEVQNRNGKVVTQIALVKGKRDVAQDGAKGKSGGQAPRKAAKPSEAPQKGRKRVVKRSVVPARESMIDGKAARQLVALVGDAAKRKKITQAEHNITIDVLTRTLPKDVRRYMVVEAQ